MKAVWVFAIAILGVALVGCGPTLSTEEGLQQQLVGMPIADVLQENPLPDKVIPNGRGGQIFIWNLSSEQLAGIAVGAKLPRLRTYLSTVMLYVDADGRVYEAHIVED